MDADKIDDGPCRCAEGNFETDQDEPKINNRRIIASKK
jgi:hypothetical protein